MYGVGGVKKGESLPRFFPETSVDEVTIHCDGDHRKRVPQKQSLREGLIVGLFI